MSDYDIGSEFWPGLAKMAEEAAEVGQVIAKIIAVGGDRTYFDGTDLIDRLVEELGDFHAARSYFLTHNPNVSAKAVAERAQVKYALFQKWHEDHA